MAEDVEAEAVAAGLYDDDDGGAAEAEGQQGAALDEPAGECRCSGQRLQRPPPPPPPLPRRSPRAAPQRAMTAAPAAPARFPPLPP